MKLPLNIDLQQILLHLLNFTLLFAILYMLLYKPVKKFMDEREKMYKEMDEKTKQNLKDSEEAKEKYMQQLENIDDELDRMRAESHKQSEKLGEEIVAQARKDSEAILLHAKEEAARERRKIINEASDEIYDMVTKATAKLVFSDTDKAYESFLEAAEKEGSVEDAEE